MDPVRFVALFDDCAAGLVLYARQWLDRPGAEDVVQEAFVRLFARGGPEPPDARAWLYVAVRNGAISAARGRQRRRNHEQRSASHAAPLLEARRGGGGAGPDDRLDAASAEAALATLPERQREVVVLRIWSGLTLAEVARTVGTPLSTVHDQYRAALRALRNVLEPKWKTDDSSAMSPTSDRGPSSKTGGRRSRA